jgi:fused signal recognition particle receptor
MKWLDRLKGGLKKSSGKLTDGLSQVLTHRKLDDDMLAELEDVLIMSDLGVHTAQQLTEALAKDRFNKNITEQEVRAVFAEKIADILRPIAEPLLIDESKKPYVITVVGVNGTGKTTTIGKLAKQFSDQGYKVVMAAADTFRAAAVEQLKIWSERSGATLITGATEADPASVAYQAYEEAKRSCADVLLVDTAGRLHNKSGLMQELQKIIRVLGKQDETAPHKTVLVLDATTGQNAHQQVEIFKEMVKVNGLIVTKLDGSAKGGVVVALAERFGLPVHAIGVGESLGDLQGLEAEDYATSLLGMASSTG